MTMTPDRWQRVKELFEAALQRARAERPEFLREACGEDEALRAEPRRRQLLKQRRDQNQASRFLEHRRACRKDRFNLVGPEYERRFEREKDALARLQHEGIARIYEAGTADSGSGPQPYFAMELIEQGHRSRSMPKPSG